MSKNSPMLVEDMRIRRTRKMIWEALLFLLEEQAFVSIRVKAICEQAMVHRATFYCHFADKYALLEYGIQEAFQTITRDLHWNDGGAEQRAVLILPILQYMATHRRLFSLLLLEKSAESFPSLLLRRLTNAFEEALASSAMRETTPVSIMAQFYAGAVLRVVTWWVEQDMCIPPEDLAGYLRQLLHNQAAADNSN